MPDPTSGSDRPDPATAHPEPVDRAPSIDQERFTDVGADAERAALREDGAYSGGDFAGGPELTR